MHLKAAGGVAPAAPAAAGRTAPDPVQKAAGEHALRLLIPSYRQAEQQRAAELRRMAEAERPAPADPRDALRQAHGDRADTQAELARLRSALGYGRRDPETKRIIEAFGFDLSPLALRYDEFVGIAAALRLPTARRGARRAGESSRRDGGRLTRRRQRWQSPAEAPAIQMSCWLLSKAWSAGKSRSRSGCGSLPNQ
jgi:Replication protein C N-terminal domain